MTIRSLALKTGLLLLFAIGSSAAQAPIDPSLPDAPLAHRQEIFLFSGYGSVMNPHKPVPPLTTRQKYKLAFVETVDLSMLLRAAFVSGFDEPSTSDRIMGPAWADSANSTPHNAASIAINNFFDDAFIPSLVHQDPRFFRKGTGSVKSRIWWGIRSQFVAFSDQGKSMPNYGSIVGLPMATALSNAYLPAKNVSFGQTMEGIAIRIGVNAGLDTAREFGGLRTPGQDYSSPQTRLTISPCRSHHCTPG